MKLESGDGHYHRAETFMQAFVEFCDSAFWRLAGLARRGRLYVAQQQRAGGGTGLGTGPADETSQVTTWLPGMAVYAHAHARDPHRHRHGQIRCPYTAGPGDNEAARDDRGVKVSLSL